MPARTVTVNLRGGLGNQLFQYAAGMALARTLGHELLLDSALLPKSSRVLSGVSHWPEQISLFAHDGDFVDKGTAPISRFFDSRFLQYERMISQSLSKLGLNSHSVYANESGAYSERFHSLSGRKLRINSYCNDRKFFLGFEELLRHQITSPVRESPTLGGLIKQSSSAKPIAIHVRLGDYKNLPHIYGEFDAKYFYRGVELARNLLGDCPLWLFSDEPELAAAFLPELMPDFETPPELSLLSGYETLILMATCSGLVGSSSSFSWWAAFLGHKPGFRAIFPRPTFAVGGPAEPKSALLEDWIQIGRQV